MSQNIKYAEYTVELNKIGYKHTFGDLEELSLLEFVKKQVYVFDRPVEVVRETTTYNIHNTKPVKQNPTKKDKWIVWNGLCKTVPFEQFCGFLGYPSYDGQGNGR